MNDDANSVGAVAAPPSTAYFTDGNNRIWKLSNGTAVQTAAFATRLSAGHDSAGNEQLYFTDGNNKLWIYTNTGQFNTPARPAGRHVLRETTHEPHDDCGSYRQNSRYFNFVRQDWIMIRRGWLLSLHLLVVEGNRWSSKRCSAMCPNPHS